MYRCQHSGFRRNEIWEIFLLGLSQLASPSVFLMLLLGVALGLTVGALPGLNDSITIAVLIPVTFGMPVQWAFALLVGVYVSSACGGSIPAVLLEDPWYCFCNGNSRRRI